MNIKQAKYHLKRIQTIIDLQDQDLSELDRNILLEDIKKLYEIILFTGEAKADPKEEGQPAEKKVQSNSEPTPPIREKNTVPSADAPKVFIPSPSPEKKPTPASAEPPVTTKQPESNPSHFSESTEPTPDSVYPSPQPSVPEPPREQPAIPSSSISTEYSESNGRQNEAVVLEKQITKQYPELFDFRSNDDLSEKLGNSKVDQLNRILAINDKILYINHLFGGEAIPFQESLKKFESFYTYEEAKSFASQELVEQYHWTDQNKKDTVRQFMKQVRRLY